MSHCVCVCVGGGGWGEAWTLNQVHLQCYPTLTTSSPEQVDCGPRTLLSLDLPAAAEAVEVLGNAGVLRPRAPEE